MKNIIRAFLLLFFTVFLAQKVMANRPEHVYLFAYASEKNGGRNGLHFAWSVDCVQWHPIGPEYSYVRSDYGRWGSQKRMIAPVLFRGPNDQWHCVWQLNEEEGVFAHVASPDLVYWGRQSYPLIISGKNCRNPEVVYDETENQYTVTWYSDAGAERQLYSVTTNDFKTYTDPVLAGTTEWKSQLVPVEVRGKTEHGTVHLVKWHVVDDLIKAWQLATHKSRLYAETMRDDSTRFAGLKPLEANFKVRSASAKPISDLLMGIFFEDINYAADGGLYAELVQNRGFEYHPDDKQHRDQTWDSYKSWALNGDHTIFSIDTLAPLHPNNKHYALLDVSVAGAGLVNEGWDGIPLKADENYHFSVFAKGFDGNKTRLAIRLIGKDGTLFAQAQTKAISSTWQKYEVVLTSKASVADARLEVAPLSKGKLALDMVSLFPQKTFKNRKNGLRDDLAQTLADLKPRFVRFPGGCVAHGDGLGNIYHWKNTIGPLEARKPQRNLWNYHQSMGLGYFEYFQFCADIGAEPLPIVAAGVPCQNSGTGGGGQQGGIPLCEMGDYVQDILDLIEWANGDAKSKWGRLRAEAGRKEPFNLKYIGVGNEDLITDVFEERFTMIYKAIKEKHPEITVIGTVGPFYEGTDYTEGWELATRLGVPIVDEHYYSSPGWFIHNQDYYDRYDRTKPKVYLGEYAAHLPSRPNNIETALAEALHLTNLERNGDVVLMASYAPLLAKERFTQWNPNLIYFNNTEVKPTVGYHVQKLFGENPGNVYYSHSMLLNENNEDAFRRVGFSVVGDSKSGDIIVKLVNLLPVPVEANIDLIDFHVQPGKAALAVLKGKPGDRTAKPEFSDFEVGPRTQYRMPAYSFSVFRVMQAK